MTFKAVCDAWLADLQGQVTGLATSDITDTHLYAPYSLEALHANQGERHLAIWPDGDPEVSSAFLAGSPPSDLDTASYTILVWEDASAETARRFDSDTANIAWLALYEAIKARFRISANVSGSTAVSGANTITRYKGGQLDRQGMSRLLGIKFTVESIGAYS